ncbi:hypothetical protein L3Q82_017249 [Scortum barcoo]|uniref:Uncharacterized protein n=1 Tax=Scortum barcoo TaxID=214431 RepID=A0ACB8VKQ1_9TELE|nr:hypothetical protein L3Q82_017249 [Scortum barcoo]
MSNPPPTITGGDYKTLPLVVRSGMTHHQEYLLVAFCVDHAPGFPPRRASQGQTVKKRTCLPHPCTASDRYLITLNNHLPAPVCSSVTDEDDDEDDDDDDERFQEMYCHAFRKFLPLFDRVLVERFTAETVTKGGIMLPEKSQGKVLQATVVAVGPGSVNQKGHVQPVSVKVGEKVLLPEYGGTKVILDDKDYFLFRDADILGPGLSEHPVTDQHCVAMVMAEGAAVLRRNRPGTKAKVRVYRAAPRRHPADRAPPPGLGPLGVPVSLRAALIQIRFKEGKARANDFYNWPDESFEEMDSTLAVQQYIQQNIRSDCSNIDKILEPPEGQDEGVWKYEHLRQFCLELNGLAVKLQSECHPDTCTQMTATEQWIFLCAAHKTPKECPAIDYTRHTLDGAACLLNSNKYFPSRVSIKESSVAKLGSVCRRIYRIFSHAYFHHRQIFDKYENETFLCHRFTRFVMKYNLMSKDNLIVPILEEEVQNTSSAGESEA